MEKIKQVLSSGGVIYLPGPTRTDHEINIPCSIKWFAVIRSVEDLHSLPEEDREWAIEQVRKLCE